MIPDNRKLSEVKKEEMTYRKQLWAEIGKIKEWGITVFLISTNWAYTTIPNSWKVSGAKKVNNLPKTALS
jgi:biotin operon repressor